MLQTKDNDFRLKRSALAPRIQPLYRLKPWRVLLALASQWVLIAACVAFAVWMNNVFVSLFAMIAVATRQHALAVLVHDGAHGRLFRSQWLNDWVADCCAAMPLGISLTVYRDFHLKHHAFTGTPQDPEVAGMTGDPDWTWPKKRQDAILLFAKDCVGIKAVAMLKVIQNFVPWPSFFGAKTVRGYDWVDRVRLVVFLSSAATAVTLANLWFVVLVYWFVPSLTLLSAIFRLRAIAEHHGTARTHELTSTRTVLPSWWERLLFAPFGVNYHLEHHLFPAVPFYNLKALHEVLLEDDAFKRHAHLTKNYAIPWNGSVLSELTADPSDSMDARIAV